MKHLTRLFGIAVCALLICALLPMISAQVHAETDYPYKIDSANFPDANFRSYVRNNIGDGDSVLTKAEAEAVTLIYVDSEATGKVIKDLTGIELFPNLVDLICSNNELAQPDLSKNTKLETLVCKASNVAVLDLSKNTRLIYVDLRDNHLGALDVRKNTRLVYLDVGNTTFDKNEKNRNNLTTLDVSRNTKLEFLYCDKNRISSLDLSNNTALLELYCHDNNLGALDLSKNTNLTYLNCSNNAITKLDITKTQIYKTMPYGGFFGARSDGKNVTVTMSATQSDNYTAGGKSSKLNTGVKVHTHSWKNVTVRATPSKNGYTRKECECGARKGTVIIPAVTTIKLSPSGYDYDGTAKAPSVIVKDSTGTKLVKGTDYTVSYSSGRKKIGSYNVTIVLQGKYSGSSSISFNIRPHKTAISSVSAKKGGFALRWEKRTKYNDGYQIQYSLKSNFANAKGITIRDDKTVTQTITGLKSGKTYYIRVRTYTNVNGAKIPSVWSPVKKVTTK